MLSSILVEDFWCGKNICLLGVGCYTLGETESMASEFRPQHAWTSIEILIPNLAQTSQIFPIEHTFGRD